MADQHSIYCPGCHQKTSVVPRVSHDRSDLNTVFEIAECNACNFHLLIYRNRRTRNIRDIYPSPLPKSTDDRIPEKIKSDFDEALLCLSVGAVRGSAVLARRAVQNICIDKGAKSSKLVDQIDELFEENIITEDIKDWAHEVRYVGNDAAHPNDTEINKNDTEEIVDLLESLCEVLYITPAKAAKRKRARKEKKSNGTS